MSEIIYPSYYRVVECRSGKWIMKIPQLFCGKESKVDQDIQSTYGLTPQQVVIHLFRINGGRSGFYLANLKRHQFYYCGEGWEDVRIQLLKLGIGRDEPASGGCDE